MDLASVELASKTSSSLLDQPGTLGFLVVFGMGVILFFVFRSMARHLRKVNDMARAEEEAAAAAEQSGAAATSADQQDAQAASQGHSADRT
jgi:Na+-transporting methylmalonyl-CoA/oxaloacetate decarboxylase gamma subunit